MLMVLNNKNMMALIIALAIGCVPLCNGMQGGDVEVALQPGEGGDIFAVELTLNELSVQEEASDLQVLLLAKDKKRLTACLTAMNVDGSLFNLYVDNVDACDELGNTLLHWAGKLRLSKLVSLLLTNGADKTKKNKANQTPLFFVIFCNLTSSADYSEMIQLLS